MSKAKTKNIITGKFTAGAGIKAALEMTPEKVIQEVIDSGLRGKGGAGFPAGLKWRFAANEKSDEKYIICNADEGEPGTFKDKYLFDNHPVKVLEGMAIAGYAIGAKNGIIYLRGEYAYLLPSLEKHIAEMKENIFSKLKAGRKKFEFDIKVRLGAGAYVCGEEFALIESLNGNRGEPRNKPPFPIQKGYLEKPTLVNNVETFATVSHIVEQGAAWFGKFGTATSKGTKLFSISGDVKHPGVYEFEMGVKLRDVLELVGAENTKSVQVGGFSGINVAEDEFDRTLAHGDLPPGGSIIVFNKDRDMLKVLKNILEFFEEESCGQCTPCREGAYQLLKGIEMMEKGEKSVKYYKDLCELCTAMKDSAKCGLGQSIPAPFLSITKNFKNEILYR